MNNDVFVKLNLKSIGEVRSFIFDNKIDTNNDNKDRYLMCAGKYDKNGWTIVFKAKNYEEAEYIIENTPFSCKKTIEAPKQVKEEIKEEELDISIVSRFPYYRERNKAATKGAALEDRLIV